ncbi:cytochrome c oxidase assembly protein COX18, mitochondrial-like [Leptopilina boulardi]|uniref:cytochrome c oxidase assembly protein COX18, mitochondrial-like n=1 Tax=Leptopilina boulardi TaxID=63433 RepID=UPI0021F5833A|nr:cytochrome c oxidase assembly protein COX18, mitochondrial-like [Leptopilina boulardi]
MNNLIIGSLVRNSVCEMQIQKYSQYANNVYKCNKHLISVFSNGNNLTRITKYLSTNSFSNHNNAVYSTGNNKIYSYYRQTELRNGIVKRSLFNNSLRLPGKLNVRYESTSSALSITDTLSEATNEVSNSGFITHKEGLILSLKDISESPLVNYCQEYLQFLHNYTGLPWWATIVLSSVILKTIFYFPLSLQQRRCLIALDNVQQKFNISMELIKEEIKISMKKFGWPMDFAKSRYQDMIKVVWKHAMHEENTNPLKAFSCVVFQFTAWLGMSMAIGNVCCIFPFTDPANVPVYSEIATNGIGWLTNLTVPDSSLILPLTIGVINLSIVGLYYNNFNNPTIVQKFVCATFGILSVGTIPITTQLPSGLLLYWLTSSSYGLALNLILLTSFGKKVLRIPKYKSYMQIKQETEIKFPEYQAMLHGNSDAKQLKRKKVTN